MIRFKSQIAFVLVALAWVSTGVAQAQTAPRDTSEILMTEAELESLLTRIAMRKKQRVEAEQQRARIAPTTSTAWQATPTGADIGGEAVILQRQIDMLSRQLTLLTASLQTGQAGRDGGLRTYGAQIAEAQRTIDALQRALAIQAYQTSSQAPIVMPSENTPGLARTNVPPLVVQAPSPSLAGNTPASPSATIIVADTALERRLQASNQLNFQLQAQIDQLYEKLQGHQRDTLSDSATEATLQAELNELALEVEKLREQTLTAAAQTATVAPASESLNPAIDLYKHTVYFANNTANIATEDIRALRELCEQLRTMPGAIKVLLRGYASTTGNPQYNVRLSAKRAEAVKNTLIQLGMDPANIITLHHGPDDTKREDLARRVEVTLAAP